MRRRSIVLAVSAVMLVATGCPPDQSGPAAPRWVTTHVARTVSGATTTNYVGAWTDTAWASTLEVETISGGGGSASVHFFPRSGAGNSVLGTPQTLPMSISPQLAGPAGAGSVVGVYGTSTSLPAVEFFRRTGSTWASAGVATFPVNETFGAMTDRWLVMRSILQNPGTSGWVSVYAIDASGPTVTVSLAATLTPDPAWPVALREGFGGPGVAVDGDLLVAGAQGQFSPTPGGARVFRATGGVWSPVLSLGASPTGPSAYGRYQAADDGTTVDRFALGPQSDSAPFVEIYADTGSGFALEQTVVRDPSEPDIFNGGLFGAALALDGDLLAVSSRGAQVPSSQTGHADVKVGYVQLFRKGAIWAGEAEVPVFTDPAPAGITQTMPFKLQAVGNHVAVNMFVSPDPPPGCTFPCFNFGFEAWSIDRTG